MCNLVCMFVITACSCMFSYSGVMLFSFVVHLDLPYNIPVHVGEISLTHKSAELDCTARVLDNAR